MNFKGLLDKKKRYENMNELVLVAVAINRCTKNDNQQQCVLQLFPIDLRASKTMTQMTSVH